MEFNIKHIIQGWSNLAFPKEEAKKFLEHLEEYRLNICKECPAGCKDITLLSQCTHCGCFLRAKARCLSCSCPLSKWSAVASDAEEDTFIKNIS